MTAAPPEDEPGPEPGRTPTVRISITVEIGGEWVSPEIIALTTARLADAFQGELRAASSRPGPAGAGGLL